MTLQWLRAKHHISSEVFRLSEGAYGGCERRTTAAAYKVGNKYQRSDNEGGDYYCGRGGDSVFWSGNVGKNLIAQ
jgi:hypothetical protein